MKAESEEARRCLLYVGEYIGKRANLSIISFGSVAYQNCLHNNMELKVLSNFSVRK